MLKIETVKKYKTPGYPDKRIVLENPDILKTMPQRWKGKIYAGLTFSSVVAMLLSGCQAPVTTVGTMPAPVSLTEEEAQIIIADEAEKYGVRFNSAGLELKDVKFNIDKNYGGTRVNVPHTQDVQLDGFDEEKKIGFEFASFDDVSGFANSVEGFTDDDVRSFYSDDYTKLLEEAVKNKDGKIYFDAFYFTVSEDRAECEADLRTQVKTFMEWLKTQGVI